MPLWDESYAAVSTYLSARSRLEVGGLDVARPKHDKDREVTTVADLGRLMLVEMLLILLGVRCWGRAVLQFIASSARVSTPSSLGFETHDVTIPSGARETRLPRTGWIIHTIIVRIIFFQAENSFRSIKETRYYNEPCTNFVALIIISHFWQKWSKHGVLI